MTSEQSQNCVSCGKFSGKFKYCYPCSPKSIGKPCHRATTQCNSVDWVVYNYHIFDEAWVRCSNQTIHKTCIEHRDLPPSFFKHFQLEMRPFEWQELFGPSSVVYKNVLCCPTCNEMADRSMECNCTRYVSPTDRRIKLLTAQLTDSINNSFEAHYRVHLIKSRFMRQSNQ